MFEKRSTPDPSRDYRFSLNPRSANLGEYLSVQMAAPGRAVRLEVITGIAAHHPDRFVKHLVAAALLDSEHELRAIALQHLASSAHHEIFATTALAALRDPAHLVRETAARELASRAALLKQLDSPELLHVIALCAFANREPVDQPGVARLLAALQPILQPVNGHADTAAVLTNPDPVTRRRILLKLDGTRQLPLPFLLAALRDPANDVRSAAAFALKHRSTDKTPLVEIHLSAAGLNSAHSRTRSLAHSATLQRGGDLSLNFAYALSRINSSHPEHRRAASGAIEALAEGVKPRFLETTLCSLLKSPEVDFQTAGILAAARLAQRLSHSSRILTPLAKAVQAARTTLNAETPYEFIQAIGVVFERLTPLLSRLSRASRGALIAAAHAYTTDAQRVPLSLRTVTLPLLAHMPTVNNSLFESAFTLALHSPATEPSSISFSSLLIFAGSEASLWFRIRSTLGTEHSPSTRARLVELASGFLNTQSFTAFDVIPTLLSVAKDRAESTFVRRAALQTLRPLVKTLPEAIAAVELVAPLLPLHEQLDYVRELQEVVWIGRGNTRVAAVNALGSLSLTLDKRCTGAIVECLRDLTRDTYQEDFVRIIAVTSLASASRASPLGTRELERAFFDAHPERDHAVRKHCKILLEQLDEEGVTR